MRAPEGQGEQMQYRGATEMVLIILAVIGAHALLAVLGIGLMHTAMMGWMMGGGGCLAGLLLGLLIIAGAVAAVMLLTRSRSRP
jgi:hypothetical protein